MSSGEREWWWWIFIYVIDGFDECTVCVRNNYHFWRYFHAINLLHLDLHLHYGPKDSPHNFPTFFLFLFFYLFCVFGEAFLFAPKENCRDSLRPRSRANHARSGRRCLHQYFYLLFYDLIFPTPHHHARRRKKFDEFSSMKREDLSASPTASWLREIFKNRIYARDLRFIASG